MSNNEIFAILDQLFYQSKLQFGDAVRSRWFYTEDACPGCGKKISTMKYKGKDTVSINTFIFREHGVLIGYLLCGKCAKQIFKNGDHATGRLPLHDAIEKTLKHSYLKKSGH